MPKWIFQKISRDQQGVNKNKDVLLRCHESLKLICFSKYFQTNIKYVHLKKLLTSNIQKNPTFLGNVRGCSQTTFTRGGG